MVNYFNYMRISTKESADKQSFNRQEKSLQAYAEKNNIEYTLNFKDDCTGSTFNRENWIKLERLLQEGDTVVFKEISRFTRQAEEGYEKYIELMSKGINIVFIDNMTVSTDYIKNLTRVADEQDLITKTALQSTIKLLLIVELDRVQKEREIIVKRIKQGIQSSEKKSGRKAGNLDKMNDELREDIEKFLNDRSIKQIDLMRKHNVSRNTLKKYIQIIKDESVQSAKNCKMTNKEIIEKKVKELDYELGCYNDMNDMIDKLSKKELNKVLEELDQESTEVEVSINRKKYRVEIDTVDNQKDLKILSLVEYESQYGERNRR